MIALTAGLAALLRHDGSWTEAIIRHSAAVQAAQHLGDRPGEANALDDLGSVWLRMSEYPGAALVLEQVLDIYRDLGIRAGEIEVLNEMGAVYRLSGDLKRAEELHQRPWR